MLETFYILAVFAGKYSLLVQCINDLNMFPPVVFITYILLTLDNFTVV